MPNASLDEMVKCCNALLQPETFSDWDGAVNGLQVENSGSVSRIAAAVDASRVTVRLAAEAGADLLLVHHGLFWGPPSQPWTGPRYELFKTLMSRNIAVYSAHLPLDAHPQLGNNAQLSKALGLKRLEPFFFEKGRAIGFKGQGRARREVLAAQLEKILGRAPIVLPGGPVECRKIGVISGAAGGQLKLAAAEGVDTVITGEGPHWTHALAEDLGLNVFYGGHYATETFGVKALAAKLSREFGLPWVFLDHPSGL
jgi:dinuclear metal center YbgI/SA1388 family protein